MGTGAANISDVGVIESVRAMTNQLGALVALIVPCDLKQVGGRASLGAYGVQEDIDQVIVGLRGTEDLGPNLMYSSEMQLVLRGVSVECDFDASRLVVATLTPKATKSNPRSATLAPILATEAMQEISFDQVVAFTAARVWIMPVNRASNEPYDFPFFCCRCSPRLPPLLIP